MPPLVSKLTSFLSPLSDLGKPVFRIVASISVLTIACYGQSSGEHVSEPNNTGGSVTQVEVSTTRDTDIDVESVTIGIPDGDEGFTWMDPDDVTVKCITPNPGNDPTINFTTPVPSPDYA